MTFEYSILNRQNYLHVHAKGFRAREHLLKIATKTLDECLCRKINNVLLDIREMQPRLSVFESTLLLTEDLAPLDHAEVLSKLALVDLPENLLRVEFFEKMAKARGICITAFESPDEATRWLSAGEEILTR